MYHSMAREDLTNPECMRYQLLDYCYGVISRTRNESTVGVLGVVPEDRLVPPFDSLFEQRVYNRIVDRGYTVHAQYPAQGYNIDMVIIGAKGKLAVECDGDFWHGTAVYEADLARQRELERCGWEFFRIRESLFYADMASSLAKLWSTLHELDIRTTDWIDPSFDEHDSKEVDEATDRVLIDEPVVDVSKITGASEVSETPADADATCVAQEEHPADVGAELSSGGHHRVEPVDATFEARDEDRAFGNHYAETVVVEYVPVQQLKSSRPTSALMNSCLE